MKLILFSILSLLFIGCRTTTVAPEAQSVILKPISPTEDGRKNCTVIKQIQESKWLGTRDSIENQFKNTAASIGGNYVHLLRIWTPGESTFGDANIYKCDNPLR